MRRINRQKTIEGTTIPGFINNMHYHFINVDVYEDGMVNCWELVDFNGLKEKLRSNWLVPKVPDGESISIFNLGSYTIQSAKWEFNSRSYYKHIKRIVRKLNPQFANIYKITSHERRDCEKRKVKLSPPSKDFYVTSELGYQTVEGKSTSVFIRIESGNYLVNLTVYKTGKVICFNGESEISYNMESIKELFENGTFFTNIENPTPVIIKGLGEIVFSHTSFSTDIGEKYRELLDIFKSLRGEESSIDRCRKSYYEYLEHPLELNRQRLKQFYELVPEHERLYLGDMDTRDSDYQRIIYTPNLKREV